MPVINVIVVSAPSSDRVTLHLPDGGDTATGGLDYDLTREQAISLAARILHAVTYG